MLHILIKQKQKERKKLEKLEKEKQQPVKMEEVMIIFKFAANGSPSQKCKLHIHILTNFNLFYRKKMVHSRAKLRTINQLMRNPITIKIPVLKTWLQLKI